MKKNSYEKDFNRLLSIYIYNSKLQINIYNSAFYKKEFSYNCINKTYSCCIYWDTEEINMKNFKYFNTDVLNSLLNIREGETKFGEKIKTIKPNEDLDQFLSSTKAQFIIYGINESVGVAANFGRIGSESAYDKTIATLVNIQHNPLCKGSWVSILGHFDFNEMQTNVSKINLSNCESRKILHNWVSEIDKQVTFLNAKIIKAGKIPIIIGGGHNNSYGNIKGLSLAKNQSVNVINFDAHTDFRALEGRHSGNGFSYAFDQDFLDKYFIFGIHENYTSKYQFAQLKKFNERIKYATFEEMEIREEKNFNLEINKAKEFIKNKPYGIEIDLDAIENVASSAITPSGYSTTKVRNFIHNLGSHSSASYLHLCEAAPSLDANNNSLIGKLVSYLITDFIKAKISIEEKK